jgi:hypothetical protein
MEMIKIGDTVKLERVHHATNATVKSLVGQRGVVKNLASHASGPAAFVDFKGDWYWIKTAYLKVQA